MDEQQMQQYVKENIHMVPKNQIKKFESIIDIYVWKVYKLDEARYGDIITLSAYSGNFIDILNSVNDNKDIKEKYSTIPTITYIPNIGTWHIKLYAMSTDTIPTGKWLVVEMNDCVFTE